MSALGDRIIANGPYVANVDMVPFELSVEEWNGLREELIGLRVRASQAPACGSPPMVPGLTAEEGLAYRAAAAGGLRPCPVCVDAMIGPGLVECTLCAGREDAAVKRATDL